MRQAVYIRSSVPIQVGIAGATGYVGAELLGVLAGHPDLKVTVASSRSREGSPVGSVYTLPGAGVSGPDTRRSGSRGAEGCRRLLLGSPSRRIAETWQELFRDRWGLLLEYPPADFRLLRNPALYEAWYGSPHTGAGASGVVRLRAARAVQTRSGRGKSHRSTRLLPDGGGTWRSPRSCNPGRCHQLGSWWTRRADSRGAGNSLTDATHFAVADGDFTAYGLLGPSPHPGDRTGDRHAGAVHTSSRADDEGDSRNLLHATGAGLRTWTPRGR